MIADVRETLGGLKFTALDGAEPVLLNPEPLKYAGVEYLTRLPDLTAYAVHFDTYIRFEEKDRRQSGPLVREVVIDVENTYPKTEANLPGVVGR